MSCSESDLYLPSYFSSKFDQSNIGLSTQLKSPAFIAEKALARTSKSSRKSDFAHFEGISISLQERKYLQHERLINQHQ